MEGLPGNDFSNELLSQEAVDMAILKKFIFMLPEKIKI